MQLKLKKTLKLNKKNSKDGFITPIEKGTVVEYGVKTRTVIHPNVGHNLILDENVVTKYFDQIFRIETTLPLAGKERQLTAKEWKRIFGYEVGLVAGAKFIPIL